MRVWPSCPALIPNSVHSCCGWIGGAARLTDRDAQHGPAQGTVGGEQVAFVGLPAQGLMGVCLEQRGLFLRGHGAAKVAFADEVAGVVFDDAGVAAQQQDFGLQPLVFAELVGLALRADLGPQGLQQGVVHGGPGAARLRMGGSVAARLFDGALAGIEEYSESLMNKDFPNLQKQKYQQKYQQSELLRPFPAPLLVKRQ